MKKLFLLIMIVCSLTACKKNSDDSPQPQQTIETRMVTFSFESRFSNKEIYTTGSVDYVYGGRRTYFNVAPLTPTISFGYSFDHN